MLGVEGAADDGAADDDIADEEAAEDDVTDDGAARVDSVVGGALVVSLAELVPIERVLELDISEVTTVELVTVDSSVGIDEDKAVFIEFVTLSRLLESVEGVVKVPPVAFVEMIGRAGLDVAIVTLAEMVTFGRNTLDIGDVMLTDAVRLGRRDETEIGEELLAEFNLVIDADGAALFEFVALGRIMVLDVCGLPVIVELIEKDAEVVDGNDGSPIVLLLSIVPEGS